MVSLGAKAYEPADAVSRPSQLPCLQEITLAVARVRSAAVKAVVAAPRRKVGSTRPLFASVRPCARTASGGWISAPGFRRESSRERRLTTRQTRPPPTRPRRCPCLIWSPSPPDRRQLLCCCRCPCPWSRCPRSFLRHQRLLPNRRRLPQRRRPEQKQARCCLRGEPWP